MNNVERKQYKDIYSKIASERSKNAHQASLENGIPITQLPIGYKWSRVGSRRRGHSIVLIDEEKAPIIRDIYKLYSCGAYTLTSLSEEIKKRHNYNVTSSSIERLLCHPFYNGIIDHKGKHYPLKAPRVIDEKLYKAVQTIKDERKHANRGRFLGRTKEIHLYRGLLLCHCNLAITSEGHTKRGVFYIYYHCTQSKGKHGAKYIQEKYITSQIQALLKRVLQDKELNDLVDTYILDWPNPDPINLRIVIKTLFKKIIVENNGSLSYLLRTASEIKSLNEVKQLKEIDLERIKTIDKYGDLSSNIQLLCLLPQTIDFLCNTLEKDLDTIQSKLIDLQLEGKIDQNIEGLWVSLESNN